MDTAIGLVGPALKELRHAAQCAAICDGLCVDIIKTVTYRGTIFCDLLTLGHLHPEDSESGTASDLNVTIDDLLKSTLMALEAALGSIQEHMQLPQLHPQRYMKAGQVKAHIQKQKEELDRRFEDIQAHVQHAILKTLRDGKPETRTSAFDRPVVEKLRKDLKELREGCNGKGLKVSSKEKERVKHSARAAVQRRSPTGQVIKAGKHEVLGVAVSPDGTMFVTCGSDGHAAVWDTTTGVQFATKPDGHRGDNVQSVAWSPDGKQLVTCADDETAKIWDVATGKCVRLPEGHLFAVSCVAWSPDGKFIATCTEQNLVRLWDPMTGASVRCMVGFNEGGDSGISRDSSSSKSMASSAQQTSTAIVRIAAWHPSKQQSVIAAGSSNGTVTVWDADSGDVQQILHSSELPEKPVTALAWSPDGKQLAAGSADCTTRLWDVATGALRRVFGGKPEGTCEDTDKVSGHTDEVSAVVWHPLGDMLVTGSLDGSAKMWDVATGGLLPAELAGHKGAATAAACTPCGRFVLTASKDRSVRVYRRNGEAVPEQVDGDRTPGFGDMADSGLEVLADAADRLDKKLSSDKEDEEAETAAETLAAKAAGKAVEALCACDSYQL